MKEQIISKANALQLLELQKNELTTFLKLYFRETLASISFENKFYPNLYLYLQTWCWIPQRSQF